MTYPRAEFDFERFYRENRLALERFIAFRVSPPECAEEIAAEVVTAMWEYCLREEVRQPRALLYRIARNRIIDFYKERQRRRLEIPIDDAPQLAAPRSLAGEAIIREELTTTLETLDGIREEYREVIVLHGKLGLTIREIADMMEKSEVNVRVLLFRARRALKESLRKRGILE